MVKVFEECQYTTKPSSLLTSFSLKTDFSSGPLFVHKVYELSRIHNLSAYDVAYTELSLRLRATVASLDRQLIKAAETSGVTKYNWGKPF
jgi:predicted nucleic acid-binding protein